MSTIPVKPRIPENYWFNAWCPRLPTEPAFSPEHGITVSFARRRDFIEVVQDAAIDAQHFYFDMNPLRFTWNWLVARALLKTIAEEKAVEQDESLQTPPSQLTKKVGQRLVMSGMTASSSADNASQQHLVDAVNLAVSQLGQDAGGEPAAKRQHLDDRVSELNMDQSIEQILFNINKAICLRLDGIESKLETMSSHTRYLEDKVEQVVSSLKLNGNLVIHSSATGRGGYKRSSAVIIGLPQDRANANCSSTSDDLQSGLPGMDLSFQSLGPNVQLIRLNTEEGFPNGTWVGDENNPEMPVRVPITPSDLLHVHSNCRTPEKMALALLDYLFDHETQATSNLSGLGKHGKRQLDPLMFYGIRCHLIHRFGITELDWHRIKQNIDSKCRTAFRRKVRGLPLTLKAFRGKAPPTYMHVSASHPGMSDINSDDDFLHEDAELHIHQGTHYSRDLQKLPEMKSHSLDSESMSEVDLHQMQAAGAAEILQTAGIEIQVLHATPEQVAQLQQANQIQIIYGDGQVLQVHSGDGPEAIHLAVSMAQQDGIHMVTTDTGETIQINTHPGDDNGMQINATPIDDDALQVEDETLHIATQGEDGTIQIQVEDGTTRQIKIQAD